MFHEIYQVPAKVNFYSMSLDIQAEVICTTYQLDSDFKEVIKVQEEPGLKYVDNLSIDLNFNSEVEIKNYLTAKQGQMPTRDSSQGIRWIDPLNSHDLDVKVDQARLYKEEATTQATNAASEAAKALKYANSIESTANYINNKFWFGTLLDYNRLLTIDPNKIYVITT